MNSCCNNSVIKYTQGNDVLFRVKYFQGESEFTLDGYDNWRVTLLRDGVVKTDTECLLDADNRVIIHCPASLPVGRYAVETTMSSLGMKRRSFLCGEIEIVECDEDANVGSGVIVSGDMAEISVTFELVSIVWTQGKNAYEFWKIDHPDGTLQEYIDLISISQQDVQNLENDVTRIQGDIRSLMLSVQTLSTEKQETLVSGENIKTINNQSILGSGNIDIQGGGEQEQADWNVTNSSLPSYIKHKPNVKNVNSADIDNMTEASGLFVVMGGEGGIIATIGRNHGYAEQVWLDAEHGYIKTRKMSRGTWSAWSDAAYYIKPSSGIPKTDLASAVQTSLGKADTAVQTETDPTVPAWAKNSTKPSYNVSEITGAQPTLVSGTNIKTVNNQSLLGSGNITIQGGGGASTWDEIEGKPDFATVATSGSYNDLTNKPTIPDAQIQSDWNQTTTTAKDYIKNKPTIPDVTGKADKVQSATNGHLAGLDGNGNLTDVGYAIWVGTESAYNDIPSPDNNTLYFIKEATT